MSEFKLARCPKCNSERYIQSDVVLPLCDSCQLFMKTYLPYNLKNGKVKWNEEGEDVFCDK